MNKQKIQEVIDSLEHENMHVEQNEAGPLNTAIRKLKRAILSDIVCASVAAIDDESSTGNIVVGVTAHCRCGHTFYDDVVAAYSKRR